MPAPWGDRHGRKPVGHLASESPRSDWTIAVVCNWQRTEALSILFSPVHNYPDENPQILLGKTGRKINGINFQWCSRLLPQADPVIPRRLGSGTDRRPLTLLL